MALSSSGRKLYVSLEGAQVKRIDRLDLCAPGVDGALARSPLVDLLDIRDPKGISL